MPNRQNAYTSTHSETVFDGFFDILELTKFRLSLTVVVSAVLAYLVAATTVDFSVLLAIVVGGFGTTMAANALNQVIERDYDLLMGRTKNRPVATGRLSVSRAVLYAGLFSLVGVLVLGTLNPLAALLGMLALISYAFVYTPLKRVSVAAVFIGTIPGAIPALIGSVAAEGELTILGWTLFSIQVLWQIPHFWAIGWLGFDDYKVAGFKLLPMTEDGERDPDTGLQSAVYAVLLAGLTWVPYVLGYVGITASFINFAAGLIYAFLGIQLYLQRDRKAALRLMFYSFLYLPLVFTLIWLF